MATPRKGSTLVRHMDGDRIQALRARLRDPKSRAPGYTHSLHELWAAYLELEAYTLDLERKVSLARKLLS